MHGMHGVHAWGLTTTAPGEAMQGWLARMHGVDSLRDHAQATCMGVHG